MSITALVATDNKLGFAKDGGIPWHCTEDMKRFKSLTKDANLIVGRKTYETLPTAVKERRCLVLSSRVVNCHQHCFGPQQAIRFVLRDPDRPTYVIGGGEIYKAMIGYCDFITQTVMPRNYRCDQYLDRDLFCHFGLVNTHQLGEKSWIQYWRRQGA